MFTLTMTVLTRADRSHTVPDSVRTRTVPRAGSHLVALEIETIIAAVLSSIAKGHWVSSHWEVGYLTIHDWTQGGTEDGCTNV